MKECHGVWENTHIVIGCLCGEGAFIDRLKNAALSSTFDERDLAIDEIKHLTPQLECIYKWTKRNLDNGQIKQAPNETERKQLIESLIAVFGEVTRLLSK